MPTVYGEGEANEYLAGSFDYRRMALTAGVCLAQIGDFYLTEKELPVGQSGGTDHRSP